MTNEIQQARRMAFEAWHRENFKGKYDNGQPTRDMHNGEYVERYTVKVEQERWEAWCAAIDSICIELPASISESVSPTGALLDAERNATIKACRAAIEQTGLGIKII